MKEGWIKLSYLVKVNLWGLNFLEIDTAIAFSISKIVGIHILSHRPLGELW